MLYSTTHMERPSGVRKGAWTKEEDLLLRKCVGKYGEGKWHQVPLRAGLNRCRKSCRLRWLNYLRPDIKRGRFTADEVDLIGRMHKLLGNKWSLIAGRLPGRTANDVKNYWNTHLNNKKLISQSGEVKDDELRTRTMETKVIRPLPRTFSKNSKWLRGIGTSIDTTQSGREMHKPAHEFIRDEPALWLENILFEEEDHEKGISSSMSGSSMEELITSLWVDDMEAKTKGGDTLVVEVEHGNSDWDALCLDGNLWGQLGLGC